MAATLTKQLFSQNHWLSDGTDTVWNFNFAGGYLDKSHVKAYTQAPDLLITEVIVTPGMFVGEFTLQIIPAVPAGHTLVIYRDTPKDGPLVDFNDGARISEQSLDTVARQAVLLGAEVSDLFSVGSVSGIVDLADAITAATEQSLQAAADAQAAIGTIAGHAAAAEASKDKAEQWAIQLVTPVEGGEFSAKYHAQSTVAHASAAASSASAAAGSASAASTSATNAAGSASAASTSATNAGNSASAAAGSASSASTNATNAANSAGVAAGHASNAAGSATAAANSASSAASYAAQVGTMSFRNKIINGDFAIWQRGDGPVVVPAYFADRWYVQGSLSTWSFGKLVLPVGGGARYALSAAIGSASSDPNSYVSAEQRIEDVRTLSGKTVTVSFDAWSSVTGKKIAVELEQYFGTGGSPSASLSAGSAQVTLTVNRTRYSVTLAVPSIAGKTLGTNGNHFLRTLFWFDAGTAYSSRTGGVLPKQAAPVHITDVQVEEGPVATPFERRPYGLELALCQRYHERGAHRQWSYSGAAGVASIGTTIPFKVQKRDTPAVTLNVSGTGLTANLRVEQPEAGKFDLLADTTGLGHTFMAIFYAADAEL